MELSTETKYIILLQLKRVCVCVGGGGGGGGQAPPPSVPTSLY